MDDSSQSPAKELDDLRAALDAHAIVAITNSRGKITFANDKFCEISQYSREELLGQDHRMINSGYHPPEFFRDLWTTISRGQVWRGQIRNRAKDGSLYWVDTTIVPFLADDGRPRQYVAIRADVTRRVLAEERVLQMNAELEKRVAERTAQLEKANRELEAFSYSISHDLRAPLRAMNGFSQAVIEDFGDLIPAEGRRYLETIRQNAEHMGDLIDDLLAFSRLSRKPLEREPIAMNRLVDSALDELGRPWPDRKVELQVASLPDCQGDASLLRQVWINLLGNALKYSGKCEVARIEVGSRVAEDGTCEYHVRDNGAGFDMRYVHKLFGVFSRLHRAEDYDGTGVGLAIVQRIVQRHGGRIRAEGRPNEGACFYFTLNEEGGAS